MPRLQLSEVQENHCAACYYFQGCSQWCMRLSCVKPQIVEFERKKAEEAAEAAARRDARKRDKAKQAEAGRKRKEAWLKLSPEERQARIEAAKAGRRKRWEEAEKRRMEIYRSGGGKLTDRQLAKLFGYKSPVSACLWRKKHGLPCYYEANSVIGKSAKIDYVRISELYAQKKTDGEIAKEVGLCYATIGKWRRAHNLPYNGPGRGNNKPGKESRKPATQAGGHRIVGRAGLPEEEHRRRLEAYYATNSDVECAALIGVRAQAIYIWRKKHGIPAKRKPGFIPKAET